MGCLLSNSELYIHCKRCYPNLQPISEAYQGNFEIFFFNSDRVLIYSGDVDSCVNYIGTQQAAKVELIMTKLICRTLKPLEANKIGPLGCLMIKLLVSNWFLEITYNVFT